MMNVRTMRLIADVTAGDSGLIPDVARCALSRWCSDPGTLKYIRSSNNHIFRFEHNGAGRFLRLTPSSERGPRAVEGELEFVLHLARHGVPVARPVESTSMSFIEEIHTDHDSHAAVVFEELVGKTVEFESAGDSMIRAWGRALGELHAAAESFSEPSMAKLRSWSDDVGNAEKWLPDEEHAAHRELAELADWFKTLPTEKAGFGAIHFDFEEDNLFWDGKRFHVCDFDCAARYWYAADIAFALHGLRGESDDRRKDLLTWFLEGYRSFRAPPDHWDETISCFVRFCVVYHFARMCEAYRGADAAEDPPWLMRMRRRHAGWFERTRKSFGTPFRW